MNTDQLLRELVALPSVNPAFLPARDIRAGESHVADFLAATAAQAGLEIEFQAVLPGRSNLLVRLRCAGKRRHRLLLAPHLDTVNGTDDQFRPRIKNGRLYGRGACDTKGSVAAMFLAICDLAKHGPRPQHTEIVFAGLIDEEHVQSGSRALMAHGFNADLAIVGEPTRLRVVTAHKGSVWLRLETRGRAAHSSRPELGRNAVHRMAKIVDLLETEYAGQLKRRRHPLLGHGTVSVGTISGGTQPNIVPEQCAITLDRRTLPGETEAGVWREIRGLLRRHGLSATCVADRHGPCPPLETDPELLWVKRFLGAVSQRAPAGVQYFCDAGVLALGGIPSVAFGPGDIAQAHTADECVSLAAVERARGLLARFLPSLP